MRVPAPILLAALATRPALFAGCSDVPDAGQLGDLAGAPTGQDAAGEAVAQAAPTWRVGQWWDHHWYFGPQDSTGFVVRSIVVGNSSGYRLATDEVIDAASHAAFYFHDLGTMGPDWVVRDFSGEFSFPWYSFPLSDGKTWTAREENLGFDLQTLSQDLTLRATAINGTPGAFAIEARSAEGLRGRWDYQPAIGWFSEYRAYDGGDDPEAYTIRMVDEAHGQGWTGTYQEATADFLLNTLTVLVPTAPSAPPPPSSFTLTAAHTHVLAIPYAFAAGGASGAELVAPDQRHWEAYQVADAQGNVVQQAMPGLVFEPAVAGDWRFATVGAAAFVAGGGCLAWGVTVTPGTL